MNEINFVVNHAPGTGSIARLVGQQSSRLPLSYGCLLPDKETIYLLKASATGTMECIMDIYSAQLTFGAGGWAGGG